ncbi:MAG: RNA polymerase factor sigma-54 [Gammaproteobacteria bacterium]|nr:RNA polymerase factor sigma-54 [Gammaproteobacteria bacterium]
MKQSLQLRLGQQLTMTPQLQQAIRLLQLSVLDLREEMQEAVESNPMLELDESEPSAGPELPEPQMAAPSAALDESQDGEVRADSEQMPDELPMDADWDSVYESPITGPREQVSGGDGDADFLAQRSQATTLYDHLMWQLNLTPFSDTDRIIATALIDSISEDGYLTTPLEEICQGLSDGDDPVQLDEVEAVLHRIQAFDPPGVGARGPQECLLLQLKQLPADTPHLAQALSLVRDHFDLLAAQERAQIRRKLKVDDATLLAIMHLIRSLAPRPGVLVADEAPQYVIPDVVVSKRNGQWHVEMNPEAMPRLRINNDYAGLVKRADSSDDNTFLRNHLQEARWLLKSLQSRHDTLLRVATSIVEHQRAFFDYGEEAMKPLVLRDIAEQLEMHESTISRVTTQKYLYSPRGTFEFKYFFSSHVSTSAGGECSATAIRALIKKLVAAENPKKPLSDSKLAAILEDQGINVARRTVAKYREALGIAPSNERKRLM